jgi:hypothetical protein
VLRLIDYSSFERRITKFHSEGLDPADLFRGGQLYVESVSMSIHINTKGTYFKEQMHFLVLFFIHSNPPRAFDPEI